MVEVEEVKVVIVEVVEVVVVVDTLLIADCFGDEVSAMPFGGKASDVVIVPGPVVEYPSS